MEGRKAGQAACGRPKSDEVQENENEKESIKMLNTKRTRRGKTLHRQPMHELQFFELSSIGGSLSRVTSEQKLLLVDMCASRI